MQLPDHGPRFGDHCNDFGRWSWIESPYRNSSGEFSDVDADFGYSSFGELSRTRSTARPADPIRTPSDLILL
jgi:hypothetical protein